MDCTQTQDELLMAEDLSAIPATGDLGQHLHTCAVCQQLLSNLRKLETATRDLPSPDAGDSRAAFLRSLEPAKPALSRRPLQLQWLRGVRVRAMAAAAILLLGIGVATWFLVAGGTNTAAADTTVDSLMDWNVSIANAQAPEERNSIFASKVAALQQSVDRAPLPADQKQLAAKLLENGSWLKTNTDPLAAAERFDEVADLVLAQLQTATAAGEAKAIARLDRQYRRLANNGLNKQLKLAGTARLDKPERKGRYERLMRHNEELNRRLQKLMDSSSKSSKKEMRREVGLPASSNRLGIAQHHL